MINEGRTDKWGNKEFTIESTGGPKKVFNQRRRHNPLFQPPKPSESHRIDADWYAVLIKGIRQARLSGRITQAQLGKLIGSNQAAISRFELGKMNATTIFIERLVEALNVKIAIKITVE